MERDTGIVTLRTGVTSVDILFSSGSYPSVRGSVLVTYTSGFATVPEDIKAAALAIYYRIWKLIKDEKILHSSIRSDFGVLEMLRTQLAPEEMLILSSYKRHVY